MWWQSHAAPVGHRPSTLLIGAVPRQMSVL
jgi:hypothetical protein